jgi:hypothetical protein
VGEFGEAAKLGAVDRRVWSAAGGVGAGVGRGVALLGLDY